MQQAARRWRYVLRMDVVRHFLSIDPALPCDRLQRRNAVNCTRRLDGNIGYYRAGRISFAGLGHSVQRVQRPAGPETGEERNSTRKPKWP